MATATSTNRCHLADRPRRTTLKHREPTTSAQLSIDPQRLDLTSPHTSCIVGTAFHPYVPLEGRRRREVLGFWREWRHTGAMPSVQIKDVPEDTHAVLRRRAAAAHQSLQEYLRSKLIEEASRPTLDEVLDRADGRAGGSVTLNSAARALRSERARR